MWKSAKEVGNIAREQWQLIVACLVGGAISGAVVRAIAILGRASRDAWPPAIGLGMLAGVLAAVAWVSVRSTITRARISDVTLKLGVSDVKVAFDPDGLQQLWRFFMEMCSSVASRPLSPGEGFLEEALKSMYSLFERARVDLSTRPPRGTAPGGAIPAHAYVLGILNEDLRPCLTRWHVRLDAWKRTGLPEAEWPCTTSAVAISK
jgi:hypothetical protein